MTAIEIAVPSKVISKPLLDLYEPGKDSANKVTSFQRVKTFWQRDKSVPLTSFYYPSQILFEAGVKKKADSLRELPKTGNYIIQGIVGQGKSIFLRHLCVQELRETGPGRIPVFLELRTLS